MTSRPAIAAVVLAALALAGAALGFRPGVHFHRVPAERRLAAQAVLARGLAGHVRIAPRAATRVFLRRYVTLVHRRLGVGAFAELRRHAGQSAASDAALVDAVLPAGGVTMVGGADHLVHHFSLRAPDGARVRAWVVGPPLDRPDPAAARIERRRQRLGLG